MAASSQIGNIDQEFFPYSIDYKNCWFWSFFGSSKGEPQEDIPKQLCPVMIFNPNQSFGSRTTNIALAQGSQNLQ